MSKSLSSIFISLLSADTNDPASIAHACGCSPDELIEMLAKFLSDPDQAEKLKSTSAALDLVDQIIARAALMKLCADGNVQALKLFFDNRRKSAETTVSADIEDIFSVRAELSETVTPDSDPDPEGDS